MQPPAQQPAHSTDSSPKWFTEVILDLDEQWKESTIQYAPSLDYDDSAFTHVVIKPARESVSQFATADASV